MPSPAIAEPGAASCSVSAASAASGKLMPQCGRPKGSAAMRRASRPTHSRVNKAMPHSAQVTNSGAPSRLADRPTTAGGAMKMKAVGIKRSGHRPCTAMRSTISTITTGQNIRPTPNCAADQASWPSATPASGTSTLPTMGMNRAGVALAQTRPCGWCTPSCRPPAALPRHQRDSTHSVTHNCPSAPAPHSSSIGRLGPCWATTAVASRITDTGSVATKVWRTGWRRSSPQASAWRRRRSSVASSSTTNTSSASAPMPRDTPTASSPSRCTAWCQASDRPVRPITSAYQPGCKYRSGAAPGCGPAVIGTKPSGPEPIGPAGCSACASNRSSCGAADYRTLPSRVCTSPSTALNSASWSPSGARRACNSCCMKQTVMRT